MLIFSALLKIYLVFNNFSFKYFSLVILVESILTFIILFMLFYSDHKINFYKWDKNLALKILIEAFPLYCSGIGIIILSKGTQIMVHTYLDSKSLAFYSVAQMVSDSVFILPMALHSSLFPYLQKINDTSKSLFNIYFEKIISLF